MPRLTVRRVDGTSNSIDFTGRVRLMELLRPLLDSPAFLCGGNGVCKKCAVTAFGAQDGMPSMERVKAFMAEQA